MRVLRLGLAQIDCTVGAIAENVDKIAEYAADAAAQEVDLAVFPELAVCGYPPEDLLFKPQFIEDALAALERLVHESRAFPETTLVVGCLDRRGRHLYNAAAIIRNGSVLDIYHKHCLPNYGVFDEKRYFTSGRDYIVLEAAGVLVGVSICEDIWFASGPPSTEVDEGGAQVVVNLNASPYHIGKDSMRREVLSNWAKKHAAGVAYVNLVGGQDELVFDGASLVFGADGELKASGRQFEEELVVVEFDADLAVEQREERDGADGHGTGDRKHEVRLVPAGPGPISHEKREVTPVREQLEHLDEVFGALRVGVADYVLKNGFSHVVLGLSGGVDSTLTAVMAVEALGSERVTTAFLPSRYTSTASLEDAAIVAENLGVEMVTVPIEPIFRTYLDGLAGVFEGHHADVTEENIQARIRGNILMAMSNKFGWLLLTTGNKSEMSVGYATLYGDMSGGFAVLKDVSKTLVYKLCRRFNERNGRQMIPERVLTKEPTAELSPDQKDSDNLPEYDILDPILRAYIEEERSPSEIVAAGWPRDVVEDVIRMVDRSEYKRRQGPPGVKITPRAFGKDWRVPVTNHYRIGR